MPHVPQRIVVALSGGVDSSVAAALLKEEGHRVSGAFIVPWSAPWLPCTWREERRDAMRVAAHLQIPFHTVDLSREYERDVVQTFVAEYRAGRTPNPDVLCNKYIKFGAFLAWARDQGFTAVATGHYARREEISRDNGQKTIDGIDCETMDNRLWTIGTDDSGVRRYEDAVPLSQYRLLAGIDTSKDQSYFLWTLTQEQLSSVQFPVGGYTKQEVRARAAAYELPTAQKKDSQGVCFLGAVDMADFLTHYLDVAPGTVLDEAGNSIGTHRGAVLYTIGQRHGFTICHGSSSNTPHYVVAKNIARNTITVAEREGSRKPLVRGVVLTDVRWIADTPPGQAYVARYRYRQPCVPVTLTSREHAVSVQFAVPQQYVACGQSLVLYDGDVCLGGGVIAAVEPTA